MNKWIAAGAVALLWCTSAAAASPTGLYNYDARGRLTRVCNARPGDGELTNYTFDRADNRTAYSNEKVDIALAPESGIYSPNGNFLFWMQSDGNLVAYGNFGSGWAPLGWSTNTVGSGATVAYFQSDGNLVLYSQAGLPVWNSNTANYQCSRLAVANDGNVTITTPDGVVVFSTNTGGH